MASSKTISITLKIWRQKNANAQGNMETYSLKDVSTDSSFLEMLDLLNEQLIEEGKKLIKTILIEERQKEENFLLTILIVKIITLI